jgi:hypothetical protein
MVSDLTILFSISKLFNDVMNTQLTRSNDKAEVVTDIGLYMITHEADLKTQIKDIVKATYSEGQIKSLGDNYIEGMYESLKSWFSAYLSEMLIKNSVTGIGFEFTFGEHIDLLVKDSSSNVLKFNELPQLFTLDKDGKPVQFTEELFNTFKKYKKPLLLVHMDDDTASKHGSLPKVGVIPADISNNLPNGIAEGYAYFGEVFHNVYLCDSDYIKLYGRVGILFKSGSYSFDVLSEKEYLQLFNTKTEKLNYYFAFNVRSGLDSETNLFCFLQETEGTITSYPIVPRLLPDVTPKITTKIKAAPKPHFEIDTTTINKDKNLKIKLDSLLDVVYQISNAHSLYGPLNAGTVGAGTVSHSFDFAYLLNYNSLLHLHEESRTIPDGTKRFYTKEYFGELLNSLNPDKTLDLSKISWFFIKDGEIEGFNDLKIKKFYQNFLDLIRSRIIDGDVLFTEFKEKLVGTGSFDLSNPKKFTKAEERLLADLRSALSTIFGYTGFTLLQMGIMNFNKLDGDFKVDFIIPSYKTLTKILNEFLIRPINSKLFNVIYDDQFLKDLRNRPRVFLSILFSGQMQLVNTMSGSMNILYSHPSLDFIQKIFPDFEYGVRDSYYHSEAYNLMYNTFYNSFAGRERFGQRIANAKTKLLDIIFSDVVDTQIIMDELKKYAPFSTMAEADQKVWLELMQMYYKTALADGLFFPQGQISKGALDPTAIIFDMVLGLLKPGLDKVLVNGRTVINNKLVQEYELEFGVIRTELLKNMKIISPSLYFTYDHLFRSSTSEAKINLNNYGAMSTKKFWDSIEKPIEHTVNQLLNIFKSEDLDSIKKFTIQFRRPSHSGINKDSKSGSLNSRVYNSKGVDFNTNPEINGHNIVITRADINNADTIRSKLFSIVYYMVKYQAFIVVKSGLAGDRNFIFSAMLNKIFGVEFLKSLSSDGQWPINSIVVPSSKLNDWNLGWNKDDVWNDLNMFIPFYLLLDNSHSRDANALRDIFRIRFGVDVEYLIRSK